MTIKKVLVLILAAGVLAAVWYLGSPLFTTIRVDEDIPEDLITDDGTVKSGAEMLSPEEQTEMQKQTAEMPTSSPMNEPMPADTEALIEKTFPVMRTTAHPASGHVRILETESGTVIRYENFSTINGPRLHVYLAKDLRAEEYVDLGPIKGTEGNINYKVPDGVDISEYRYVMYWCVPFSVLFNYADISQ